MRGIPWQSMSCRGREVHLHEARRSEKARLKKKAKLGGSSCTVAAEFEVAADAASAEELLRWSRRSPSGPSSGLPSLRAVVMGRGCGFLKSMAASPRPGDAGSLAPASAVARSPATAASGGRKRARLGTGRGVSPVACASRPYRDRG